MRRFALWSSSALCFMVLIVVSQCVMMSCREIYIVKMDSVITEPWSTVLSWLPNRDGSADSALHSCLCCSECIFRPGRHVWISIVSQWQWSFCDSETSCFLSYSTGLHKMVTVNVNLIFSCTKKTCQEWRWWWWTCLGDKYFSTLFSVTLASY